jgi:hypothetical protein
MVDNKDCDKNAPKLDVKIIPVSKEELRILFSNDGGQTYYNEGEPRIALRIPDDDGKKNIGGSSSKGGKKGTNDDRRKLVEKTLKQAQRKLSLFDGSAQIGEDCGTWTAWCAEGLVCCGGKCAVYVPPDTPIF